MQLRVVGIGTPTIDRLIGVPSRPSFGTALIVEQLGTEGGGPVATALVAVGRLGVQAALATRLGPDETGKRIIEGLEGEGIDLRHVEISKMSRSASSTVLVDPEADRAILYDPGDNTDLDITEELLADIAISDGLMLERTTEASLAAATHAQKHDTVVLFDAGGFDERVMELSRLSTIVIGSEYHAEARGLRPVEAVDELLDVGVKAAVITLGAKGSVGRLWGGPLISMPSMEVRAVDTTGAGDVYHGAFMAAWLREKDLENAMRFASVVAALKCTKPGGRAGIPSLNEANTALSRWSD